MIHTQLETVIAELEASGVDAKQIQALREIDRRIKFIEELLGRHLPEIVGDSETE